MLLAIMQILAAILAALSFLALWGLGPFGSLDNHTVDVLPFVAGLVAVGVWAVGTIEGPLKCGQQSNLRRAFLMLFVFATVALWGCGTATWGIFWMVAVIGLWLFGLAEEDEKFRRETWNVINVAFLVIAGIVVIASGPIREVWSHPKVFVVIVGLGFVGCVAGLCGAIVAPAYLAMAAAGVALVGLGMWRFFSIMKINHHDLEKAATEAGR